MIFLILIGLGISIWDMQIVSGTSPCIISFCKTISLVEKSPNFSPNFYLLNTLHSTSQSYKNQMVKQLRKPVESLNNLGRTELLSKTPQVIINTLRSSFNILLEDAGMLVAKMDSKSEELQIASIGWNGYAVLQRKNFVCGVIHLKKQSVYSQSEKGQRLTDDLLRGLHGVYNNVKVNMNIAAVVGNSKFWEHTTEADLLRLCDQSKGDTGKLRNKLRKNSCFSYLEVNKIHNPYEICHTNLGSAFFVDTITASVFNFVPKENSSHNHEQSTTSAFDHKAAASSHPFLERDGFYQISESQNKEVSPNVSRVRSPSARIHSYKKPLATLTRETPKAGAQGNTFSTVSNNRRGSSSNAISREEIPQNKQLREENNEGIIDNQFSRAEIKSPLPFAAPISRFSVRLAKMDQAHSAQPSQPIQKSIEKTSHASETCKCISKRICPHNKKPTTR